MKMLCPDTGTRKPQAAGRPGAPKGLDGMGKRLRAQVKELWASSVAARRPHGLQVLWLGAGRTMPPGSSGDRQ